jgi:sulfonate transport system ATP-binding protein
VRPAAPARPSAAAFDFVKRRVLAALDRSLDRAVVTDDGETRAAAGGGLWW